MLHHNHVELRGGLMVDGDVIRGLVDLENRGCTFRVEDGRIYVEPMAELSEADRTWLTAHRLQALGILGYCVPDGLAP